MKKTFYALALCVLVSSCSISSEQVIGTVLTKNALAALTPDSVISSLIQGNARFASKSTFSRDINAQLAQSATLGQAPEAIVLSCIDSRVPVEMIFDKGLGDIFVARVAGNVVSGDILGSMEYAVAHAGSKVVMVLGHSSCGAVHSAIHKHEGGNTTDMLAKIKPAICQANAICSEHESSEYEMMVIENNVRNMVARVRAESEIVAQMEQEGKVKVVGAIFDLNTGLVRLIHPDK